MTTSTLSFNELQKQLQEMVKLLEEKMPAAILELEKEVHIFLVEDNSWQDALGLFLLTGGLSFDIKNVSKQAIASMVIELIDKWSDIVLVNIEVQDNSDAPDAPQMWAISLTVAN